MTVYMGVLNLARILYLTHYYAEIVAFLQLRMRLDQMQLVLCQKQNA